MDKWELDGVDLDLEGEGDFSADRVSYAAFVHQLSAALKAKGKILTVDSFHSPCDNAPNMRWWGDWVGDVATIHSHGLRGPVRRQQGHVHARGPARLREAVPTLFRYSWQLDYGMKAGYRRDQIVMGMPTWVDAWGFGGLGPNVVDHLREVRALGAGVGLWDMQLAAAGWSKPATWDAVVALRRPGTALARHVPLWERIKQGLMPSRSPAPAAPPDSLAATEQRGAPATARFHAAPPATR